MVAECFRLLPRLVKPLLAERGHAVWLLPTPAFRRTVLERRGWPIPRKTSDPVLARCNLLERAQMFTDHLFEEAKHLELSAIEIDTTLNEDEVARQVMHAFRL